ncbi:uncharacterized protein LOC132316257 [Cornus florida]|uniref:uncharacterized protein LOC132316257 n=1 Tax=Cornus florida TaxID=4283 RepID=UPI00289B4CE6|nr:uncharacterized protein LOC132316257 [Cornus florida]
MTQFNFQYQKKVKRRVVEYAIVVDIVVHGKWENSTYGFSNPICSTCDGLVLFRHDNNDLLFCVANLVTNQILTRPPLFEPIRCSSTLSTLVYAHSSRKYKVVRVFPVKSLEFKYAILTVGAETPWTLIDTKLIPNTDLYFSETHSTLFAGGYLYWTPGSRVSCSYLLALDVESEKMHRLPNPKSFIGKGGYFIVKESFLAFMVRKYFLCEVWALTELNKGSEWTRLYNIDLSGHTVMLNEVLDP